MVPALLIPRQKAPKTHNYKVSLDNGLTLEFTSDKLLGDKEVQDVVDGMNADGTIEKMALAANKKKAATKAANEKQAAKMVKAKGDLELLKTQTKNAQRKAREASMGYNIGESIIGAAKAVEANPAVKEFNRIMKMVDSNLPSGRIVEAGINALPPEAKKVVKGIRDSATPTSLVTGTAETVGGLISRPEKTSYEQYGVAFDPKADPVQRLAAAINIIGTAFSVGGATRTIAKKLPSQAELKALQDALTATKGRKATRGEAFNEFQKLRKLSEEQAKATVKATAAAAVASAKAAKAGATTTPPTAGATTATTPPTGAATTGTPKAKPKSRTAAATPSAGPTAAPPAAIPAAPTPVTTPNVAPPAPTPSPKTTTADTATPPVAPPVPPKAKEPFEMTWAENKAALQNPNLADQVKAGEAKYAEAKKEFDAIMSKNGARVKAIIKRIGRLNPTGDLNNVDSASKRTLEALDAELQELSKQRATMQSPIRSDYVNAEIPKTNAAKGQYEHKNLVEKALQDGKVVPQEVLNDYPDLAVKYKPAPIATPKAKPASRPVAPTAASALSGTPAPPIIKPPVVKPAGTATPLPKTAGNNASINRRRIFEGRPEIESGSGTVANRTFDPKDYDYNDFQESLRQRAKDEKPAPFDKAQQEAWTYHREQLEARQAELNAKVDAGDTSPTTRAAIDALDDDINIADKMGVEAGTIGSLAFSARRSNPFDYSPANIKFKAYKFNGKEKLSPETSKKLSDLLKEEKKLSDAASGATKFTEAEAKEAAAYITSVGKGIKKAATAQQRAQALDAFREGIRSLMNKASLGLDPMDLVTMAPRIRNLARAWVAPGSKLDDVVDGILADAEMIAKQDPKLSQVLLKPDGSLLLDREDIIRVLASKERDGVRALRDNIDIDLEAKRYEIDTLMADIKESAEYRSMTPAQRAVLEVAGLSRGLQAGFDRSAMLNQGLQALSSNPRASFKAFKNMNKAAKSEQALQQVMGELRTQPNYKLAVASKLKVNGTHVSSDEIGFAQGAVGKIPGANSSNRAYAAYLSTLRMEAFNDMARAIEKKGGKLTVSEADQISEFVNSLTGAGTGKLADLLTSGNKLSKNLALFAPSYRVARGKYTLGFPMWQAIGQARKTRDYRIVKEIGKRYGMTAAAYGTLYTLLELHGVKTDYNPASKNFMKVRLPGTNAYIDPTGGLLSFVKFMARVVRPAPQFDKTTGEPKRGEYGEQKFSDPQPWVALGNYLGGAAGPVPAAFVRAITKKAYGKSYDYNTKEGKENMVWALAPIWIQQARDIQNDPKLTPAQKSLLTAAVFFGASVDVQEKEVPRL